MKPTKKLNKSDRKLWKLTGLNIYMELVKGLVFHTIFVISRYVAMLRNAVSAGQTDSSVTSAGMNNLCVL